MFDYRNFLLLCWYTCLFYRLTISAIWIVSLFLTAKKVFRVLRFFTIRKNGLSFVEKMKLNVQRHLKCWLWRLASLLGAKHKLNWEDVNDDDCPARQITSTTDENIEAVNKRLLNNRRITIRVVADNVGISFGSWLLLKICWRRLTTIQICSKRS